jgi:non-specific serine/threonine protein kinase
VLLMARGFLARYTGRLAEAAALFQDANDTFQRAGIKPTPNGRWQHATTLFWSGELERANALEEDILADSLAIGDIYIAAAALCDLGSIAFVRGDFPQAASRLRQAITLARKLGDVLVTAFCLDALAATASAQGRPEDVALLLGAAERLFERSGIAPDGIERTGRPLPTGTTVAELIDSARNALGESAFAAAREAGRTLPLEAVLAEASLDDEPLPSINIERSREQQEATMTSDGPR